MEGSANMEIGIFSKVFKSYPLDEAFQKIKNYDISTVQFNFSNVGLDSLPSEISDEVIQKIKNKKNEYDISIPIVSGTFNTLELDEDKHEQNMHNFKVVVEAASELDIPYVSISTGSFNQEDFWSPHPENHTEKGWERLYKSLDEMLEVAISNDTTIVVEPEQANVVSTAEDTLKLLAHYDTSNLKVLYDAANIVTTSDANNLENKIDKTLNKLSDHIAIAHCKDCVVQENKIEFVPVGKGNLPLKSYIKKLKNYYSGPVFMHGLEEEDVEFAMKFLTNKKGN